MRLNDTLAGMILLLVGIAVAAYAWTFPTAPGQPIGPGLFPLAIGVAMSVCGAILCLAGIRRPNGTWIEWDDWLRRPRMLLNAVLVIGGLIFYALAVDTVGFFLTAFVFLVALFWAFGVRRRWIAPFAIAVTVGLHVAFYTVLRVPLPWGWLESIAW